MFQYIRVRIRSSTYDSYIRRVPEFEFRSSTGVPEFQVPSFNHFYISILLCMTHCHVDGEAGRISKKKYQVFFFVGKTRVFRILVLGVAIRFVLEIIEVL